MSFEAKTEVDTLERPKRKYTRRENNGHQIVVPETPARKQHRTYTDEEKANYMKEARMIGVAEASRKLGIHRSVLDRWMADEGGIYKKGKGARRKKVNKKDAPRVAFYQIEDEDFVRAFEGGESEEEVQNNIMTLFSENKEAKEIYLLTATRKYIRPTMEVVKYSK